MYKQSELLQEFLTQQRDQENSKLSKTGGWNSQKQLWFPHSSLEGGEKTIAYGIKLIGINYDQGISDQMAIQLQLEQYCKNENFLFPILRKKGYDPAKCDTAGKMIANDLIFNVGQGGFLKFKNFTKALGENNKKGVLEECQTFYRDASGKRCEMLRRNKFRQEFINKYWGNLKQ